MKSLGMLGLGIIVGILIPILFVWGMIRWFIYAFKQMRELETSGIRAMATVTRLKEHRIRSISIGASPQARNVPRKYFCLSARWQDPRTGKTYTLRGIIVDPTKFPVGSSVAFLINPKHPGWWHRLENLQDAFGLTKSTPCMEYEYYNDERISDKHE